MERLIKELEDLGVSGTEDKAKTLIEYREKILKANENINLTAITDRDEFIAKHIIDSLGCANLPEFEQAKAVIDVGTGGGFPGVPLAVAFPDKEFTLIDSLNKRLKVVETACRQLGINNVEVIHGRAEDLAREEDYRDYYDLCVSRAVAPMNVLCELCLPFVRKGGSFIAFKGPECVEEVKTAAKAMEKLDAKLVSIIPQLKSQGMEGHSLVLLEKTGTTDPLYPRRAGKPAKSPL